MTDRQRENLNMLGRVQTFGRTNDAQFSANTREGRLLARLDEAIEVANAAATTQSGGAGGSFITKSAALLEVQRDLRAIARTARSIDEEERPGTAAEFTLPSGNNAGDWLARANVFLERSEALDDLFVEFKLPADFRQDLAGDIADYDQANDDAEAGEQTQVGGTAELTQALADGLKVIRQLDGIVANIFEDDPAKRGEWQTARHVARLDRTPKVAPKT